MAGTGPGVRLERIVASLGVPFGRERSVKLVPGALLTDRVLMTLHRRALGPVPQARLDEMLAGFAFPARFRARLAGELPRARILHFGHEGSPSGTILKLYLELPLPEQATHEDGRLVHIAFKWDPEHPERTALARYRIAAGPEAAIAVALGGAPGEVSSALRDAVMAMLAQARPAGRTGSTMTLLVEEDDNPRRSLDINLYDAELGADDCTPALALLWPAFGLPGDGAAVLSTFIGTSQVGHIAAGITRDGQDFFTIYYGLEGR